MMYVSLDTIRKEYIMNIQDLIKPENQMILNEMNSAMQPIIEKIYLAMEQDPTMSMTRMTEIAYEELKKELPEGSFTFVRMFIFPVDLYYMRALHPCR